MPSSKELPKIYTVSASERVYFRLGKVGTGKNVNFSECTSQFQSVKCFRGPKIWEYRTQQAENMGQNQTKLQKYKSNPIVTYRPDVSFFNLQSLYYTVHLTRCQNKRLTNERIFFGFQNVFQT